MKINIKALHMSITPDVNDYIEKRLGSLSKFENEKESEATMYVEVELTTKHHQASEDLYKTTVNLECGSIRVRGEATDADLKASIDKVKDELMRELVSKKDKRMSLTKWGGQKIKNIVKGFRSDKGTKADVALDAAAAEPEFDDSDMGE